MKTYIFDLDGTLLNTLGDLTAAVNVAMRKSGFPERSLDEVRQFIGNGIRNLILRAVPEGTSEEGSAKAFADFRAYYSVHYKEETCLYDGIAELLDALQAEGAKLAIVSNKADPVVQSINAHYFSKWDMLAIGELEGVPRKPAPDCVYLCMERLGAAKEDCVYIGDSDVDIETARNTGIPCIAVTWGFRPKEFLLESGAEQLADSPAELYQLLKNS